MGINKKITDNISLVGSEQLSGSGDCHVYAIHYKPGKVCLIDAGVDSGKKIYQNINTIFGIKAKITHLILTHCHIDHIGAAHQFKAQFPNMEIIAHSWDTPAIEGVAGTEKLTAASWYGINYKPVKVDQSIKDDEYILRLNGLELKLIHTPGHTPGSISVIYVHPKFGTILFGQDIHGPFMEEFNSNVEDWRKSMKYLLSFEPDILCEGHYGIIKGKSSVRKFIESHLRQH
ncbi:MBL fold metallo-hydrolase [Candidatus Harpocratesius sp.]